MKTVPAGWFKTHCLRVMEEIRKRREPVLVTKKGVPMVKIVPADTPAQDAFGCLAGRLEIAGDIESPVLPAGDWEATS